QERMHLENGLRQALRDQQFFLQYQPLVNPVGRIMGMEALIRWKHPEEGVISPGTFIPLAEETRLIVTIGEWVLRAACEQLQRWHAAGYDWLYIAVNVSTRQFREPDFVDTIERVLKATGLNPHSLKLEVTESSIMENPDEAIAKMNALCATGVHFSIDDFGTGYSSLSQMKRFPIDTLKIDQSFVADSMINRDDQEIIKAILSMAQNLHIETVAEGVETLGQKDFLIREGCQMLQGYYFGRPLSSEDFEARLKIA
ncbi:MAG: EAL domain-containing protein, partial [Anaerolineales bacterium]|nr:EAL domain-containing protein [Anaerolineales bacterium]